MGPIEQRYHEEVERRAAEKLKDVSFCAEALSEMEDETLESIGANAAWPGDMYTQCTGRLVLDVLWNYAKKIAQQDILWEGWDAQREFEEELRDNEMDARREERAEMMATRKPE